VKAYAYIEGRNYVVPDDVKNILYDAVNHRIILSGRGKTQGVKIRNIVDDMIRKSAVEK
jgi:MoxR-like ATPase